MTAQQKCLSNPNKKPVHNNNLKCTGTEFRLADIEAIEAEFEQDE